jgi:23S rRNA pseudouridine1911/1915/1917 synthase
VLVYFYMDILLETDNYIVINKPAGLVVHGDGKTDESTLVDLILKEKPEIAGVGEPMLVDGKTLDRPGIVHRLDRETSGVMIIVKNQETFEFFKQQFKDHKIQKEYHAFVWGHFKETSGLVDAPIGRSSGDFRRWQAGRGTRGEERGAITAWKVASSFEDENNDLFSLVHLFPKTGRTHQLRVHMKYLQRPIVSDSLYAPTKPQALGFSRVALHAHKISFLDQNGESVEVQAPYPADFQLALARYVQI